LFKKKKSTAKKFDERNLRIENLEIKVWTQNFRIKIKQKTKNGENSDTSRYGSTKYTRLTNHPDQQCYGKSSKYCFINLHNEHAQQMAQTVRRRQGTSANSLDMAPTRHSMHVKICIFHQTNSAFNTVS